VRRELPRKLPKAHAPNLSNERPTWLGLAHKKLAAAVFAAYVWDPHVVALDTLSAALGIGWPIEPKNPVTVQQGWHSPCRTGLCNPFRVDECGVVFSQGGAGACPGLLYGAPSGHGKCPVGMGRVAILLGLSASPHIILAATNFDYVSIPGGEYSNLGLERMLAV
jgi:hypothetical protein